MTTASASETLIAGAARPSPQARTVAVPARAVAAAAVPARESPPRAAVERLAATGPAVSAASQPAGRAVAAVSAAMRPSGSGAARSAERAAAVMARATAPAGLGSPRCAEPAASVVVAVRAWASRGAVTVLSEAPRAASAPVGAPAEQAAAPAEQAAAPAEQAAAPAGLWQRAAVSVGPRWQAAVLAEPVSPRVVVPATRAWSARDAQESAPMAASSTRPRRRRQPGSGELAALVSEPDWRRRKTAAANPNAKGLRPRSPTRSACAWSARAAVSRTKRPARASIRAGSGRPATLRSYAAATQHKSSKGGISKERFTSPTHGQEEETLLNLPV